MRPFVLGKCPNCDAPVSGTRSLFCGERCRQIGELVRYARRKLADGTYDRPDIAEAITIRRDQLAWSFYDKRGRAVSQETRDELLARSKGRCEKCKCKFTPDGDRRFTVQHTATKDGFVLEAWCYRCNMDHAQSVKVVPSEEQLEFLGDFIVRVHAQEPLLQCDDPVNWPATYQKYLNFWRRRDFNNLGAGI